MEKNDIIANLTAIFIKIFNEPNLVLNDDMTANDVDGWDSLSHMLMITAVEEQFDIKFKLKELNKMKRVEDLIAIIESKL